MSKNIRIATLLFVDSILIIISVLTSYMLRFDFQIDNVYLSFLPYVLSIYIITMAINFTLFKIYKRVWQYASIGDLISIFKGALFGAISVYLIDEVINFLFNTIYTIPRSIHIMSIILIFLTVGGSRFLWRIFRDNYMRIQPHHQRALVIGAGEAGVIVVRELKHSNSEYYPVAFIDDNPKKQRLQIMGVPVVGNREDIRKVVKRYDIKIIIIAMPSASKDVISDIVQKCKETRCQVKIVPSLSNLINGSISVNTIRDVSVEDLLGREPIKVDLDEIAEYLSGKVVLVTGAGGSIGSELCRQIGGYNPKSIVLLGRGENSIYNIEMELQKHYPELTVYPVIADIQHKQRINEVFEQYRPEIVFHAAAHKHVPLMEKNAIEAIKNNIMGTYNVVQSANRFDCEGFVMISTDKAVNPTNVMGASKQIAEAVVQSYNQISKTRFIVVRFGNVLGSRGSVIPLFKKQIHDGGPVTVTHPEMTRYFMTIPEAVQLVIQSGAMAVQGEVFVLDMGEPVKIDDLARDLIRLSGFEPDRDIKILYTGIRPGEKLFEELLTIEEGMQGTKHDRIYIGKSNGFDYKNMLLMLKRLEKITMQENAVSNEEIRKELSIWAKGFYKPDYSKEDTKEAIQEALKVSMEVVASLESK